MGSRDVRQTDEEHASIAPIYMTIDPGNPNAQHVICSYQDRAGAWCVDLFLIDKTKPTKQELELISTVAGGGLFSNLTLLYFLGKQ